MPTTFSRSIRSLSADNFRRPILGLLLIVILLGAGIVWSFLARISIYEVSETARLEVLRAIYPVEAAVSGRINANHMALSQEVQAGDVLVELDAEAERLQLEEKRIHLNALSQQIKAIDGEIKAEKQAQQEAQKAASLALEEEHVQHRAAEAVARFAEEESQRLKRLHDGGHLSEVDLHRARVEAQQRRAAADALQLTVNRLVKEQQAAPLALDEARARYREAEAGAQLAEEETERLARLQEGGAISEHDARRAKVDTQQQKAAADALRLAVSKLDKEQQAAPLALDEAQARYREAEAIAQFAEEEAERLTRLYAEGHPDEAVLRRAELEAQQRQIAAESLSLEISRLEQEHQTQDSDREVRIMKLRSETSQLEGEIATTEAAIEGLEYEMERRRIRAPVAGQLGDVAELSIGAFIQEGVKLGTIVPPGELRVIAYFQPSAALGRIRPGQPARVRLEGFPWTQYGSVSATVASVAHETRHGRVRVEFDIYPDPASPIPLQHGMPGTVEVQVERVSPAILVLRAAGRLLSGSANGEREELER